MSNINDHLYRYAKNRFWKVQVQVEEQVGSPITSRVWRQVQIRVGQIGNQVKIRLIELSK